MIGYYQILETIASQLKADMFCKTVTSGSIFNIALNKQDIYPISHIVVNSFREEGTAFAYNLSVISMDLVNDDDSNEQDVIHTQSMVGIRLVELLKRGNLFDNKFQLLGGANYEFFRDRFEDKVAGCTATFDVLIPNDMTIC
jgi:hypothetical protein